MYRLIALFFLIGSFAKAQNGEVKTYHLQCTDGKERPYVVYAPKTNSDQAKPLIVFLHGAIANPEINAAPEKYVLRSPMVALADAADAYLLFPFGQKGATWFDSVGTEMVMSEIEAVKKQYAINENKIFLSGFSDGGSGTYYIAMTNPEPFAGFIPLNGNMKVADMLGEEELFIENTNQKPFFIINTTADMLYPLEQITPAVELLKSSNPNVVFHTPEGNHTMEYMDKEREALVAFIGSNTRKPLRHIVWETSSAKPKTIGWLTIAGVDTLAVRQEWHTASKNTRLWNNKADLGIKKQSMTTEGLKVELFKSDTATAKRIGLKEGDVLIAFEQDSIKSSFATMMYTAKKHADDSLSVSLLRDGKTITLKGKFNKGYPYRLFKRKRPTAKIEAVIEGEKLYIRTSRVKNYEVVKKALPLKIKGKAEEFINKP